MRTPVSIIICTRNRAEHLLQTLASVGGIEVPEDLDPELLVVDNASVDGTVELARTFPLNNMPLRVVQAPQPGLSRARNVGIKEAKGEIFLFTDDDVRLPANWLQAMTAPIRSGNADAVAGRVELAPHLQRPWMEDFHRATLASTDYIKEEDPGVMMGASMVFHRRVLEKVPGFDPELGAGALGTLEESLFSWQIVRAGFKIVTVSDAVVVHHCEVERLSRAAYISAAKKFGRCNLYLDYHWRYTLAKDWGQLTGRAPWVFLVKRSLRWFYWRVTRRQECQGPEGISHWEFYLIINIYKIKQFLKERRRPRLYDEFGLAKRGGLLH